MSKIFLSTLKHFCRKKIDFVLQFSFWSADLVRAVIYKFTNKYFALQIIPLNRYEKILLTTKISTNKAKDPEPDLDPDA